MPRDSGGTYTLPAGNPVTPGTIIESTWANPTMSDIGAALSDSLSRSGKGGMTAALRGPDGSAAVPTFSFTNEPSSGRYRDGPGRIVESVQGTPVIRYSAAGLEQWNSTAMDWEPLTPRDAANTPFDPGPTSLTSTNVQDAIEEVYASVGGIPDASQVAYDDTNVYFGAPTVQQAIDILGIDLSGVASDVAQAQDDIVVLDGEIDILDTTVQGLVVDVNQNESDIGLINTWIGEHALDYNALASRMTDAENDIIEEKNRIQPVSLGGTGVTQSTGTGKTVLSNSPVLSGINVTGGTLDGVDLEGADITGSTISEPQLSGPGGWIYNIPVDSCNLTNCTVQAPDLSDSSTAAINAGWVKQQAYATQTWVWGQGFATEVWVGEQGYYDINDLLGGAFGRMYWGGSANGTWVWWSDIGIMVQFGGGPGNPAGSDIYFPITMPGAYSAFAHMRIAGHYAVWPNSTHISIATTNAFRVNSDHDFDWFLIGPYT